MDKLTMSWDSVLMDWYKVAIDALRFCNTKTLMIPQNKMISLFKSEERGLNMNVVMCLCNNVEDRHAEEMGYGAREWAEFLLVNHEVATRWQALAAPAQKKIYKEVEIMNRSVTAGGLKLINGKA